MWISRRQKPGYLELKLFGSELFCIFIWKFACKQNFPLPLVKEMCRKQTEQRRETDAVVWVQNRSRRKIDSASLGVNANDQKSGGNEVTFTRMKAVFRG